MPGFEVQVCDFTLPEGLGGGGGDRETFCFTGSIN
jgi:hypothetical protein